MFPSAETLIDIPLNAQPSNFVDIFLLYGLPFPGARDKMISWKSPSTGPKSGRSAELQKAEHEGPKTHATNSSALMDSPPFRLLWNGGTSPTKSSVNPAHYSAVRQYCKSKTPEDAANAGRQPPLCPQNLVEQLMHGGRFQISSEQPLKSNFTNGERS